MGKRWYLVQIVDAAEKTVQVRLHHGGPEYLTENRHWRKHNKSHPARMDRIIGTAKDLDEILEKAREYLAKHGERVRR